MSKARPSDSDITDRIVLMLQPADSNDRGFVKDENCANFARSLQQHLRYFGPGHVLELAEIIKARSSDYSNPVGFRQLLTAKREAMLEIGPLLVGKLWRANDTELRQVKDLVLQTPRRGPWYVGLCQGLTAIEPLSYNERRLALLHLLEHAAEEVER